MTNREVAKLVGSSARMRSLRLTIRTLAPYPWPVRIEGPSGSGKNLAARYLHDESDRSGGPFVHCSVPMIQVGLEVGELVGHVRGAFTGAVRDRGGLFEQAHNGTLFLDEIATASPTVQLALLQLIDEPYVRRIGEHRARRVNVRIVCATNADLEAAVLAGEFRSDLFYRLGDSTVKMPPLARHREDIPELVQNILERMASEINKTAPLLSAEQMALLFAYDWPGNVRELENMLKHLLVFGTLPLILSRSVEQRAHWRDFVDEALRRHNGNKTAAARELGISRNTLYKELRKRRGE